MKLHTPFCISSRLLIGVNIGPACIQLAYATRPGDDGGTRWRWTIDIGMESYSGEDLQSGCNGGNLLEGFDSLLAFLCACGDSRSYRVMQGKSEVDPDGSEGLFPPAVAEFAEQFTEELSSLKMEIAESEESEEPLIDES